MNDKYISVSKFKQSLAKLTVEGGDKKYAEAIARTLSEVVPHLLDDSPAADVQPVNQWISVDDKLPEWDKTVLVWYASDTLFGVSEGYGLSWYHGSWRLNDLNGENIRIFYWQYLPEKPKGDDE